MDPRNYMHDDGVLHAWFIFNQHTEISFVFTQTQIFNIHKIYSNSIKPLEKWKRNPYLLGGPASCSWWRIPIHPGPLSSNNYSTLGSCPIHPFPTPQPTLHHLQGRHQQSRSSLSGTLSSLKSIPIINITDTKINHNPLPFPPCTILILINSQATH
jgi:hypothetical protein